MSGYVSRRANYTYKAWDALSTETKAWTLALDMKDNFVVPLVNKEGGVFFLYKEGFAPAKAGIYRGETEDLMRVSPGQAVVSLQEKDPEKKKDNVSAQTLRTYAELMRAPQC